MGVMLQRCVVAVSLWCIWSVLAWSAYGQEKSFIVPSNFLDGQSSGSSGVVQPAYPLPELDRAELPRNSTPHQGLASQITEQWQAGVTEPLLTSENPSLLVSAKEAKPVADGKEKCGGIWFTSMSGLVMTRDHANDVELSFSTAALNPTLLTTRDAAMDWAGGFDVHFGRFFNNRQQAWEVVYWGLFSDAEVADATDPDSVPGGTDLNTAFLFDFLAYNGAGNPVVDLFNGAARHRLVRDYEFHNIEVNLWGNTNGLEGGRGLEVGWLAGIRFFRFRDSLQFLTDASDGVFTGAVDEVTYLVDIENRLLGVQLGGLAQGGVTDHWSLHGGIKVGLFGNHITNSSELGGAAGSAFVDDPTSPFHLLQYRIRSHKNDVAILGEIDLGTTYQIREHWRAFFGYRAVALAGAALSTNQFPEDFSQLDEAAVIRSNGSLILHGAYAGIELLY
ncbi:MAG TPA: hypothetical protein EYN03_09675 [Planctomycetes bacterium]|nr:hypothetical protein [Planctomycetaceae bacterium]HIN95900.1 hypothetical protein [Planctomycetota bacterium]